MVKVKVSNEYINDPEVVTSNYKVFGIVEQNGKDVFTFHVYDDHAEIVILPGPIPVSINNKLVEYTPGVSLKEV
jgi:hypothetical protein